MVPSGQDLEYIGAQFPDSLGFKDSLKMVVSHSSATAESKSATVDKDGEHACKEDRGPDKLKSDLVVLSGEGGKVSAENAETGSVSPWSSYERRID